MKSFFSALVLFSSLTASAGPEEHLAQLVCYNAAPAALATSKNIPDSVCLESLYIDTATEQITAENYFDKKLLKNLKISHLTRHNEDYFSFVATTTAFSVWNSGCGDGEQVQLQVSGTVDNYGYVNPSDLTVKAVQTYTNDTCHSQPQTQVFDYKL